MPLCPWRYLGASVGEVRVLGDDGGFGNHNTRAGVLKLGVDADVFSLAEAFPVDLSADGHLAVRDEHAGNLLLIGRRRRSLRRPQPALISP